jgi:hypothetical protein
MSDRVEGVPTLETRMDDVRAVMDAAGSERAAVLGSSEGGPMSALFAATYPDRCWALVLFGTFASGRRAPDYPWAETDEEHRAEIESLHAWGTPEHARAVAEELHPNADPEEKVAFETLVRQSASPGAAVALSRMNREIAIRGVLAAIHVPTLVLNRSGDHPYIVEGSRYLAEHIPRHASPATRRGTRHRGRQHACGPGRDRTVPAVGLGAAAERRGSARARARDRALHRHRGLDGQGRGARRQRLARAPDGAPRPDPRRAGALPRPRARHGGRRLLRELRRARPRDPVRESHLRGGQGARARRPRRAPYGRDAHGEGSRGRRRDRVQRARRGRAEGPPRRWRLFAVERVP